MPKSYQVFISMLTIRHTAIIATLLCLTACNQAQNPSNQPSQPVPPEPATPSQATKNHLQTLLATTLNNGFLLSIRQHNKLDEKQKQCLAEYDKLQSLNIADELINKNLTDEDIAEANDFYQQPIGQKLIAYNQEQASILQDVSGKTALKPATFSDDEQLQFGAFLATKAGGKIQHLVTQELQSAVAPIEQKQVEKCQIPLEIYQNPKP